MKKLIITGLLMFSGAIHASSRNLSSRCIDEVKSVAEKKFQNLEYGCYGNAVLVEDVNKYTFRVTVEDIGGAQVCSKKIYELKISETHNSCKVVSINRVGGIGGI